MNDQGKPESPLAYHEEPLPRGGMSYSVTQQMTQPTNSPHVRSVAIYIPQLYENPSLSIRIVSDEHASPLIISSLKINDNVGGYMQIAVAAQTLPPGANPVAGVHYCNIVAIGRPKPQK